MVEQRLPYGSFDHEGRRKGCCCEFRLCAFLSPLPAAFSQPVSPITKANAHPFQITILLLAVSVRHMGKWLLMCWNLGAITPLTSHVATIIRICPWLFPGVYCLSVSVYAVTLAMPVAVCVCGYFGNSFFSQTSTLRNVKPSTSGSGKRTQKLS